MRAVHQMLPSLVYGDAIGNHVLQLQGCLRSSGYASEIYTAYCDPRYQGLAHDYRRYRGHGSQTLIYHYSIGSPVHDVVTSLPDRVILNYHNVTPAGLLGHHSPPFRAQLAQGRERLASLRNVALAVADSDYNRSELLDLNFPRVVTIPVMIDFARLDCAPTPDALRLTERFADGLVNMLFVGRLVPSKRQSDLICLLAFYQHFVDPAARLLLVGTAANAPTYPLELEAQASALGARNVEFLGQRTDAELAACYRLATVFVSMSEHEGLGVPLLEAMHCEVPVLAYGAAAVADTLGLSGLLFHAKQYEILAEVVAQLASKPFLRAKIVKAQTRRVAAFAPQAISSRWLEILS